MKDQIAPHQSLDFAELPKFQNIVLGFSIFNGYYSSKRIATLVQEFKDFPFFIFLPDGLSRHTLGLSNEKIKRQDSYLYNKTSNALKAAGLNPEEKILFFSQIDQTEKYLQYIKECKEKINTDLGLQTAIAETLQKVSFVTMENYFSYHYILYELPTLLYIKDLYGLSVKTALIYHQDTKLFSHLFANYYQ